MLQLLVGQRATHLQKLVELHLPVFVQIHLVQDLVKGLLSNLHADALERKQHSSPSAGLRRAACGTL